MIEDYKILQIVPITDNKIYIVKMLNKETILKDDDRYGFDFEACRIRGMALIEYNAFCSEVKRELVRSIEPIITEGCFDIVTDYYNILDFDNLLEDPYYRGKVWFDNISREHYIRLMRHQKEYNSYDD